MIRKTIVGLSLLASAAVVSAQNAAPAATPAPAPANTPTAGGIRWEKTVPAIASGEWTGARPEDRAPARRRDRTPGSARAGHAAIWPPRSARPEDRPADR